jgi:hypothetical protein
MADALIQSKREGRERRCLHRRQARKHKASGNLTEHR